MTAETLDRLLPVRARVRPRPDPPYDRLYDPIVEDIVADGPLARECFATRWRDDAALSDRKSVV